MLAVTYVALAFIDQKRRCCQLTVILHRWLTYWGCSSRPAALQAEVACQMSFAFKKFSFFQQHEVKIHGFPSNSTCHCLGGSLLYVGCDNGTVHLLDDTFQTQGSLNAYGYKVLYITWSQVGSKTLGTGTSFTACAAACTFCLAVALQPTYRRAYTLDSFSGTPSTD